MSLDFFEALWGFTDGEVRIARKDITDGRWFTWPKQQDDLLSYVDQYSDEDLYLTVTTYTERKRKSEYAGHGYAVYADADTADPTKFRLEPSIIVNTSPGHWQLYWMLDDEHSAADLSEASKRISLAHKADGCDAGWITTKLLRVPGTKHTKTAEHHDVTVQFTGNLYSLAEVNEVYSDIDINTVVTPLADRPIPGELPSVFDLTQRLSGDVWSAYMGEHDPAKEMSDRMWWFECELFRQGFTVEEVYVLVKESNSLNKFDPKFFDVVKVDGGVRPHRPNPDSDLWRQVCDAAARFEVTEPTEYPTEDVSDAPKIGAAIRELTQASFLSQQERDRIVNMRTFVDRFVDWVGSKTDAPACYPRTLAYLTMSAVLGNSGYIPFEWANERLNLWGIILGGTTTSRKSTTRGLMMRVLHATEKLTGETYDLGGDFTREGLFKNLQDKDGKSVLIQRDEVQGFFAEAFTKSYQVGLVESLTDIYSGALGGTMRAQKGASSDKRAEVALSIMFMGIEDQTAAVLTSDNFRSGFLTRFLWCIGPDIPLTKEHINVGFREEGQKIHGGADPVEQDLAQELALVYKRHAQGARFIAVDADAAERINEFVSLAVLGYAKNSKNADNLTPAAQRLNISVTKAAGLLALMDGTDRITLNHVLYAIRQGEEWWGSLDRIAAGIAASGFEKNVDDIERYIHAGGGKRMLSTVFRQFQNHKPKDMDEFISALVKQGRCIINGKSIKLRSAEGEEE